MKPSIIDGLSGAEIIRMMNGDGTELGELRASIRRMKMFVPRLGIAQGGIGRVPQKTCEIWWNELRRKKRELISLRRKIHPQGCEKGYDDNANQR